jgi:hypothetical protein
MLDTGLRKKSFNIREGEFMNKDLRTGADFRILDEVSEGTVLRGKRFNKGLRDYPYIMEDGMGSMNHPLANHGMGGIWDTIVGTVNTAIGTGVSAAKEAATTAVSTVIGRTGTAVAQQPAVQAAVTGAAYDQAASSIGQTVMAAPSAITAFIKKNKVALLAVGGGLAALYIYKTFIGGKRR